MEEMRLGNPLRGDVYAVCEYGVKTETVLRILLWLSREIASIEVGSSSDSTYSHLSTRAPQRNYREVPYTIARRWSTSTGSPWVHCPTLALGGTGSCCRTESDASG